MRKRLRAGFTMGETLVTIALLGIVFSSLAAGIITATKVYQQVTEKANAQTLMSTCIIDMTNDLKHATSSTDVAGTAHFNTSARGYTIYYENSDTKGIMVVPENETDTMLRFSLVTNQTNTGSLIASLSEPLVYDATKKVFTFTIEIRETKKNTVLETQQITVRPNQSF